MIHLLCHGICRLLTNMLKNFVSKRVLYRKYATTMKTATQIKLVDLNKESNFKSLNLIEGGTKAKRSFSASILDGTVFWKTCFKFYISAATQFQMKLPFDNNAMLQAQYLYPKKRKEAHSTSVISSLSFKIVSTLGNEAKKVFISSYITTVDDDIVDKIRQEWKMHQVGNIPSAYFQKDVDFSSSSSTKQKSHDAYWEKALNACAIYHGSTECSNFHHSHKKRNDSLETRAVLLIFSLELEISGVAVQSIHQNSKNGDFC